MSKLSHNARRELLTLGRPVVTSAGMPLVHQGEHRTYFTLILAGLVKVSIDADNGTSALLGLRGPGELLGELDGQPSYTTVTTVQETIVRHITRKEFLAFLSLYPEATIALLQVINNRLRQSDQRRLDLTAYPAVVRLARILVELADSHGTWRGEELHTGIAISQPDLASLAGVSLPTAEKALAQLQSRNILTRRYRSISVPDLERLRLVAEHGL
ncbi:Crp/Fnr family transcriptional regulator [Streptomyces bottropensis]|uniref:Crp/Fnr family transcriptional regulator n=1 Tax=Streptomyces bottropensis TaxID=42235 RepID=UPI003690CEF0